MSDALPASVRSPASGHTPVLAAEVLTHLAPTPGCTIVDCTAGRGGHASLLSHAALPGARVLLMDLDQGNLAFAVNAVVACAPEATVVGVHGSFAGVAHEVERLGWRVDVLLADLGFASNQMDDPARGFSFMRDGPLDMRLDPSKGLTAADLVNGASESELARIFAEFGEERRARPLARKIVAARRISPIHTTASLVEVVKSVVPVSGPTHPATRAFQALRIAVNDELGHLDALLDAIAQGASAGAWLADGARVGVLSFHSLEDRAVKHAFERIGASTGPFVAREAEVDRNPRSRSAKLRVLRIDRS